MDGPPLPKIDLLAYAYAHRGLWSRSLPENSLPAFRAAAQAGLGCELDVRPTRDGNLVVFHDATLERMCGDPRRVEDLSLPELQALSLPDRTMIPLFEEAIDAMGNMPVLVEVKVDQPPGIKLAETVAGALEGLLARATVMSFDEAAVARLRVLVKNRPIGQLIESEGNIGREAAKAKAARAIDLGVDYLAPHFSSLEAVAEADLNAPLVAWTIRDEATMALVRQHNAAPIFEGLSAHLAKPPKRPI